MFNTTTSIKHSIANKLWGHSAVEHVSIFLQITSHLGRIMADKAVRRGKKMQLTQTSKVPTGVAFPFVSYIL